MPEKVLVYACFPNVMIKRDPFTVKSVPGGTINCKFTHLLSFFCSLSMFTHIDCIYFHSLHISSQGKIMSPKVLLLAMSEFHGLWISVFFFCKQHSQCRDFWPGPFAFSPPRMRDPGKNCLLLLCGKWQQSSFGRLKAKWKNTSMLTFPLPILTESMSAQFSSSGIAHRVSYEPLTKGNH